MVDKWSGYDERQIAEFVKSQDLKRRESLLAELENQLITRPDMGRYVQCRLCNRGGRLEELRSANHHRIDCVVPKILRFVAEGIRNQPLRILS